MARLERGPRMTEKPDPKTNIGRLLMHLENGSLAYRFVKAGRDRDIGDPTESMKAVLRERLEEVRRDIDDPKA